MRKFGLIFGRNVLFLRRNPKIIVAIFTNSVYFGLVLVAVFFHVGSRYVSNDYEVDKAGNTLSTHKMLPDP